MRLSKWKRDGKVYTMSLLQGKKEKRGIVQTCLMQLGAVKISCLKPQLLWTDITVEGAHIHSSSGSVPRRNNFSMVFLRKVSEISDSESAICVLAAAFSKFVAGQGETLV